MIKKVLVGGSVVLLASLVAVGVYFASRERRPSATLTLRNAGIVLLPQSRDLPKLDFTDQSGQASRIGQLEGRWTLVFFGYTFCPDLCPTTLAELRELMERLAPKDRDQLRVLLVSVDPDRDTPEQLKRYLEYFNPAFIGWRGGMAETQRLAESLSIPFIPPDTSKPGYSVEHSGNLAILGPDGRQRGFIRSPLRVEALANALPDLLKAP